LIEKYVNKQLLMRINFSIESDPFDFQTIERHTVERLSKDIDWEINTPINTVNNLLSRGYINNIPRVGVINKLNYNAALYNFDDNAFFSKTYTSKLSKNLFSSTNNDTLLYYYLDKSNIKKSNLNSVVKLNKNLNKLQKILKSKNITLYFMPAVDKYNLYSKYIIENKYKDSVFFETIRPLYKSYIFIDTKKILRKLTNKGIKDVYYSDDTHWSYKASKEIVNNINFK